MLSKERVLRAVDHQEADRAPFGIFGTNPENEERIRRYMGLSSIEEMYRKIGIDIWYINPPLKYIGEQRYYLGEEADYWGIPDSVYKDGDSSMKCPLSDVSSIDEVESYKWPSVDNFSGEDLWKEFDIHSDFAIIGGVWAPIFHNMTWLCGFENTLINLKLQPEISKELIRRITDFWVDYTRKTLELGKGKVDIVQNCNDFGTQNGMIMSPKTFREFFKPALKRLYDVIKKYDVKVMQHSCGAIASIIPDLIEIGVDIINPVQVSAAGMDIEDLAKKFGAEITFFGGIDTQHLLPEGPIEKVREVTRRTIDIFRKNGGYILAASQGLEPDIPVEHILAMYDEGGKKGK